MDKRITIKDVARAAGVSVATVSYVLNNRQDQKISAATRTRVLQTVAEMGYTPARPSGAADRRTGCAALCFCAAENTLLQSDSAMLAGGLVRAIEEAGMVCLVLSPERCEKIRRADVLICVDASEEQLRHMTLHNSIPVLGLNSLSAAPQWGTVCCDYSRVMRQAQDYFGFDFCVVACSTPNQALQERIEALCGSDVFFCGSAAELLDFIHRNGERPLAVCSPAAYELCAAAGAQARLIAPEREKLCAAAAELAHRAALGHAAERRELFIF